MECLILIVLAGNYFVVYIQMTACETLLMIIRQVDYLVTVLWLAGNNDTNNELFVISVELYMFQYKCY